MELVNALKKIGLTQQEAVIYIHLCQHGEITGYEAAKLSGISRSNAYASLSNLVDKGYAHMIDGVAAKYVAVPKEELITNAKREFQETVHIIEEKLNYTPPEQEPYINIAGEAAILNKIKNILGASKERIYLSCPKTVLDALSSDLEAIVTRGLKLVILSTSTLASVSAIYYPLESCESIKLIADTKEVLAGTLFQSLYSKNSTLVSLIRETFINEIAIIDIKSQDGHK